MVFTVTYFKHFEADCDIILHGNCTLYFLKLLFM